MAKDLNKILFYIDSMERGGAQRVMVNIMEYCNKIGITIVLVNDFPIQADMPHYTLNSSIKRLYLAPTVRGNILIKNFKRIYMLRKIIKEEAPDIVLSFLGRPNYRMLLSTIGLDVKKIVSVRNDPNVEYGSSFCRKFIANNIFRLADGCVFQTNEASKFFNWSTQKKGIIIFNPIANSFYNKKRIENPKNIVSVGRLERQKNHTLLIKAFAQIADKIPNDNLIIYGEGSLRDSLQNLINVLHLERRVFLAGNTNNVAHKLSECKVFVLSSNYEGMPNALMEAMAIGIPCISTDCPCGGPKELIINNQDGILVPVNDIDRMSSAISELLKNTRLREKLGENAKKRAEKFKAERIYSIWKQYFEYIINKSSR